MKTKISIKGDRFLINDKLVYGEIANVNPKSLGLLWNQRVVQGIFDDKIDRSRFDMFKAGIFDPEKNTDNLIASLPEWYSYGLRAITVSFQGGWPVSAVEVSQIDNNPFGTDGTSIDPAYASRMDRVIRACDEIGMVCIVSILYWAQAKYLKDGRAVVEAVKTACTFLKNGGYTNVIIEIANEYNISPFNSHPIVHYPEGMATLMQIAREASGDMLVGCSGGGAMADREVVEESDVVIIHGNGSTRGEYYDFLQKVKGWADGKPILCNEDSPCCSRVDVALECDTSWGYYNNYTKQIPPAEFSVLPGEDFFFARRIARAVGISIEALPFEEQFYLQGLENWTAFHGKRAIRLAAEFPEEINYVDFYLNGNKIYRSYDEPFFLHMDKTWLCKPWEMKPEDKNWKAVIKLRSGDSIKKSITL